MNLKFNCSIFFISLIFFVTCNNLYANNKNRKNNNYRFIKYEPKDSLPCFLVISDIHLHSGKNQSKKIDSLSDCGDDLWESSKKEINQIIADKKPKFILLLGDIVMHHARHADVQKNWDTVYTYLAEKARKENVPLIIVPGNNDSYYDDYTPLKPDHPNFFYSNSNLINDISLYDSLGCYSVYPLGKEIKFKVIVMNTVIFSSHPGYGSMQETDAKKEIIWLNKQLQNASDSNEHVIITMHVPPGKDGYDASQLWYSGIIQNDFLNIVDSFKKNIISLISGHSHMDGIRLLINSDKIDNSRISASLFSVPGIAPGHGNNPSIKLFTYDPNNKFELVDFTTYYMNYWDSETMGSLKENWNSSFSFKNEFNTLSNLKNCETDNLKNYIDSIYYSKSKKRDSHFIDSTIYVTKIKLQ